MVLEQVCFYDVEHLFHLAEDEDAMMREGRAGLVDSVDELAFPLISNAIGSASADPTIGQKLPAKKLDIFHSKVDVDVPQGKQLGRMHNIIQPLGFRNFRQGCLSRLGVFEDQSRMVA